MLPPAADEAIHPHQHTPSASTGPVLTAIPQVSRSYTPVVSANLVGEPTAQEIESITSEIASLVSGSSSTTDKKPDQSIDGIARRRGNIHKSSDTAVLPPTSAPSFADTFDSVLQTMLIGETNIEPWSEPHWLASWHALLLLLGGLIHGAVYAWELKQHYPDNWLSVLDMQLTDSKLPDSPHIVRCFADSTPRI